MLQEARELLKDSSNQQNQSSSTGPGRMNLVNAVSPLESDFFDEKEYRPSTAQPQIGSMNILKKIQVPSNATFISEHGVEMQYKTSLLQSQIQFQSQSHIQISHSKNFRSQK